VVPELERVLVQARQAVRLLSNFEGLISHQGGFHSENALKLHADAGQSYTWPA
jgi:hypothetical protein